MLRLVPERLTDMVPLTILMKPLQAQLRIKTHQALAITLLTTSQITHHKPQLRLTLRINTKTQLLRIPRQPLRRINHGLRNRHRRQNLRCLILRASSQRVPGSPLRTEVLQTARQNGLQTRIQ